MTFAFSDKDRNMLVHNLDDEGFYVSTVEMLIEAHTGLPAKAAIAELPETVLENQRALYDPETDSFTAVYDYRGAIIYNTTEDESAQITELGDIPEGWTLKERQPISRFIDGDWVEQLDLAIASKQSEVTAWRDTVRDDPNSIMVVDGIRWDSNPMSRDNILQCIVAGYAPPFWTDADNVDQPDFTLEKLQRMYQAVLANGNVLHQRQRQMKKEIGELTDIEDVKNYPIGWGDVTLPY